MTEQQEQEHVTRPEKFCSFCGLSFLPLPIKQQVSRTCADCGKTVYTNVSPAENGIGFVVKNGESLHINIPTLSLDPKISFRLFWLCDDKATLCQAITGFQPSFK